MFRVVSGDYGKPRGSLIIKLSHLVMKKRQVEVP